MMHVVGGKLTPNLVKNVTASKNTGVHRKSDARLLLIKIFSMAARKLVSSIHKLL